ncbi:hypothetical protein E4U59_004528 [Claviceps monticola]|nr:hypothetical protein E4U59_004528 [Claviceps monticola]
MTQLQTAAGNMSELSKPCAGRRMHAIQVLTVSGPRDGVENPLRRERDGETPTDQPVSHQSPREILNLATYAPIAMADLWRSPPGCLWDQPLKPPQRIGLNH